MKLRHSLSTITLLGAITVSAACGSKDRAEPLPPVTSSPSTPTSQPTAPPTRTAPAWESKYTKPELAAYRLALARYTAYDKAAAPIWDKGKVTDAARQVFNDYTFDHGQGEIPQLQFNEDNSVRITGLPGRVLNSRATLIKASPKGGSVLIRQCVNYSKVHALQHGQVVPSTSYGQSKPRVRSINMEKLTDTRWGYSSTDDFKGERTCTP